MDYPRVEYPTIVDKSGRHLVWNRSTHSYEEMAQDERSRENYKTAPEQWGFDPAETEIPGTPVQDFGKFGSSACPKCGSPADGLTCPQCQFPLDQPPQGHVDNQFADRVPKRNYLNQGDQGATSKVTPAAPVSDRQGGVLFQKSNDDLAFEAMTFGPRVAATLDDCPECGDVMVDRDGGKKCANCGHQQAIIQAEAHKQSIDLNPVDLAGKGVEFAQEHPWETAGLLGAGALVAGTGGLGALALPAGAGGLGLEAGAVGAGELGAGELGAGVVAPAAAEAVAPAAAETGTAVAGAAQAPGRFRTLLNAAKTGGKGAIYSRGIQGFLGDSGMSGGGAGQGQVGDYEGTLSHTHQSWEHE